MTPPRFDLDPHPFDPYDGLPERCAAGTGDSCPYPRDHRVHRPDLHDGPVVDGDRPTWFCRFADVPVGFEWRSSDDPVWIDVASSTTVPSGRFVQTRLRRLPPAPGDRLGVVEIDNMGDALTQPEPITFAELCEVLIEHEERKPGQTYVPYDPASGDYRHQVADRTLALADALWFRLMNGSTP